MSKELTLVITLAATLLCCNCLYAQSLPTVEGTSAYWKDYSQRSVESAIEQAKLRARQHATSALDAIPVAGAANAKTIAPDVAALAEQYKDSDNRYAPNQDKLLIFVSTSMPKGSLERIGREAAKVGGVIVLRGIRGPLGVANALHETMAYLEPAARTGATIQIDPESFRRYSVAKVPAVLIASERSGCGQAQCEMASEIIYGDVSIGYALEEMVKRSGPGVQLAANYLRKLEEGGK